MHRNQRKYLGTICCTVLCTIISLSWTAADVQAAGQGDGVSSGSPGAVYTMSNAAGNNEVLAYDRSANGTLTLIGVYATGGMGTGGGLGNQGAVVLSNDHNLLFVVNAGSNDISALAVTKEGLVLADIEPSLGERPVSIALHEDLLYVLNAGGAGGIQGFTVDEDGEITPIPDSMRPLSGAEMTGAAQISFTPDGGVLVVTEKPTSLIDTYVVGEDGTASGPNVFASSGMTPFGFDFTARGSLIVSEAFGGMPALSAASSYDVESDGTLNLISASVASGQTAACWAVVDRSSRFVYTTNTGSDNISGYAIDQGSDSIKLLDADGITAGIGQGAAPIDAAFSTNGRFLYVLNSGTHEISVFRVHKSSGGLTAIQTVMGLPESANGMAAH